MGLLPACVIRVLFAACVLAVIVAVVDADVYSSTFAWI